MLNYQALSLIVLTQGHEAARAALSADNVANPHNIAMRAAVNLQTMGAKPEVLATINSLVREFEPDNETGGRGRVALSVGMVREYRAQAVEGSDAFIRLPVGVLGIRKGENALVTVEKGLIKVTLAE